MTRRDEDQVPRRGGHAADRRRQFERERGLPESEGLHLDKEATGGEKGRSERSQEDEQSGGEGD